MNKEELLASGGLDFTVSKRKMQYIGVYDGTYDTDFSCTVNDKTGKALSPVGSKYTIKQNKDLLDSIIDRLNPDTYDLSQSKCGMFGGGKKVFFFIKLTNVIDIPFASDSMDLYLYALSSHDGSQRLTYGISTRMHSCSNMFATLMADVDNNHVLKHTKQISSDVTQKLNGLIKRNADGLLRLFTIMADHTYSDDFKSKFMDIVAKTDIKNVRRTTIARREKLTESIWVETESKGNNYYGLFNGLTHYLTHEYETNHSSDYEMLTGSSQAFTKKAFNMIIKELVDKGICLN